MITALLLSGSFAAFAQDYDDYKKQPGTFSLGTRNTISAFNDDDATGKGIGGQFRLRLSNRLNSEWFFDYITSKAVYTYRNDYHIGWSVMFYPGDNIYSDHLLQPYFLVGHCFDYSKVTEQANKTNSAGRLSMATQAGAGTHINITELLDCSLSGQYMIHFGKEIETITDGGKVVIQKRDYSNPHGHLLFTVSFNYKFFHLW